jgi:glutamate transport system substrate-binding protein
MANQLVERFTALDRRGRIQVIAAGCAGLLVLVSATVALTRFAAGDTVADYLAQSGIANRTELRIGVSGNAPQMSHRDKAGGNRLSDYSGFDIEIARSLAAYLGYDEDSVRLVQTVVQNRARDLDERRVDVVVSSYSMTPEREQEVDFAGPYLLTQPEVLMRRGEAPKTITFRQLGELGKRLCTTGSSTSEKALRERQINGFDGVADSSDCVAGLRNHTYDAFMLDETVLAGYKADPDADPRAPKLELVDLVFAQSEKYGIAVANGDEKLRQVIGNFLIDSYERGTNGAWQHAWTKTLGTVLPDQRQPRPNEYVRLRDYRDRIRAAAPVDLPGAPPRGTPVTAARRRRYGR